MAQDSIPQSERPTQVCILWHPPEDAPSERLLRVLDTRGFAVAPVVSMHQAFAGACASAKWAKRVVLVLDDRSALSGVDRVLDGLERFAPDVICWEHCKDENPPMIPVVRVMPAEHHRGADGRVRSPLDPESDHTSTDSTPGHHPKPNALRLVGDEADQTNHASGGDRSDQPARATRPISARDVLDADELDALLAGEFGEGRRGK